MFSYSQTGCDCPKLLNLVIDKVENEYPGFWDKTKDTTAYNQFKNELKKSAQTAIKTNCGDLLNQYCIYFKDRHLGLYKKIITDKKRTEISSEIFDYDVTKFNKYLTGKPFELEGVWKSGGYMVGIKKQNDSYIGFVIKSENPSWKENEIKFKLLDNNKAEYHMGDHSEVNKTYVALKNCILDFKGEGNDIVFRKEFPEPIIPKDSLSNYINEIEGFYIRKLSEKTLLFRIASFEYAEVDRINELISSNKSTLDTTDNLIIDLRGNGGGTDIAYRPLLPYIFTNPRRVISGEYLVSQTLIDNLENWANTADTLKEADEILSVRKDISRMKKNIGKFIPYSETESYGFSEQDYAVSTYPKNIVVLVDKKSGSSTDNFLLKARQSKKVKLFGTPSAGVVDYLSLIEFKIGCPEYSLYMPTVRSLRLPEYPLDNIGIQPDVYMDKFIGDWVEYAKLYLEN